MPSCCMKHLETECSPCLNWGLGEWQGNSHQFKTLSALLTGKSAHALYLWLQSRLLQHFCFSEFPPRIQGSFSPLHRTPGLGHPNCGSTGSLPKAKVHSYRPSHLFRSLSGSGTSAFYFSVLPDCVVILLAALAVEEFFFQFLVSILWELFCLQTYFWCVCAGRWAAHHPILLSRFLLFTRNSLIL